MGKYKLDNWQDYWVLFDSLILLLQADEKAILIAELKDAQRYVNGLTDGWFEFKFAFEKSVKKYRHDMSSAQIEIADFLLLELNKSLSNR